MSKAKIGDVATIAGPDGSPLNGVWKVLAVTNSMFKMENVETKRSETVHSSRLLTVNGRETGALERAEKNTHVTKTSLKTKEKPVKAKKKITKKKTQNTKSKSEKINIKDLTKDGSEIWERRVEGFDHKDYVVKAYYLVSQNKKVYRCFNTYNGSLGKNSGGGIPDRTFDIKNYEKWTAKAKQKGYKKR